MNRQNSGKPRNSGKIFGAEAVHYCEVLLYCNANEKCDILVRLLLSLTMPCLPKVFKNCFGVISIVITGDKFLL